MYPRLLRIIAISIFLVGQLGSSSLHGAPGQSAVRGQPGNSPLAATISFSALGQGGRAAEAGEHSLADSTTPSSSGGLSQDRRGPFPLGALQGGNGNSFTPTLRANFPGLVDNIAIAAIPPDTQGSVGPEHLMSTLNSEVAVMTRQGQVIGSPVTLSNFWHSLNHQFVFDPKVLYDHWANRWFFVSLADPRTPNSALLVATSRTADPTQTWNLYALPANPPGNPDGTNQPPKVWIDYPNLGYNQQWLVASVNTTSLDSTNEEETGTSTATIFVFDKASLYSSRGAAYTLFKDPQFTVVPAVCFDNNPTNLYLVTEAPTAQKGIVSQLRLSRIQGLVGQESYVQNAGLTPVVPAWSFSPGPINFAAQRGTAVKIFCNDSRMQSCVLRNGSLWCVHHVFLPAGPETNVTHCAVQWWQMTTNGAVLQRGRLEDSASQTNYIFPSLAVNRSNDVVIGYTSVAPNQYASAAFAYRQGADLTNTLSLETTFKDGLAPYRKTHPPDTDVRWGDFSSTVVDPLNDIDIWTVQEYAESPVSGADRWGTWWACLGLEPQIPPVFVQQPQSQPIWSLGTNVTLTASLSGTEPFTYQWLFNQTNLVPATNRTLVITNFQPANVGTYSLLASNVAGYARSQPATLILVPVDIVEQPQNQTVRPGATTSFHVVASGATPLSYQWFFSGTSLAGASSDTLVVSNCQANNVGSYSVVVSNAVSSMISTPATLELDTISPPLLSEIQLGPGGIFQMLIVCEGPSNVQIQYSNDLKNWQELLTQFTTSGFLPFSDPSPSFVRQRFYRVIVTQP